MLMTTLLMAAAFLTSCSKSEDDDSKGGGGIMPDPNVPVLSEIKYELSPTSTIVSEATTKQLTNVDTLRHKLTLPASATKPEVGQTLIFSTPTSQLPDGLLAKVKSVTESDKGYEISYEDAELKDAFKDIDVPEQYIPLGEYVQHVYDANGKEINFSRVAKTRASGIKDFTIVIPEVSWEIIEGIELTPKMTIDLLLRYVMTFGDYELSYAAAKVDADVTIGADLSATLDNMKLGEKRWRILQLQFAPIPVPSPPAIPILLLKPAIGIDIVAKSEGKISLEASISYERSMHASIIYQKGAGLSGDFKLDPEADDALKFSFGPKFEGGFSFGPSMLIWYGVYGKALCLTGTLDMLAKQTISGKLDLTAFTGTSSDLLTPFAFDVATHSDLQKDLVESLKNARKWNFLKWEDLMYNISFAEKMGFKLIALGTTQSKFDLPEVNVPIASIPVMPQVKIDEKDFFDFKDNDVTLKLHHTKKSLLDNLVEFRAEFKPVTDNKEAKAISKQFDFDDEKRNLLVAEIKGADVTSTTKATLNGEDNYDITVYMNILGTEIPIFEAKAVKKTDGIKIKKIQHIGLSTSFKDHEKGKEGDWYTNSAPVSIRYSDYSTYGQPVDPDYKVQMTQDKDNIHVELTLVSSDYYYHTNKTVSFDITGFKGDFSTSKIENLKYKSDGDYYFTYKYVDEWGRDQEYNDDYGRIKEITEVACDFSPLPPINTILAPGIKYSGYSEKVNIGTFQYGGTDNEAFLKDYSHKTTVTYKKDPDEQHTHELISNSENEVILSIEFEYE